VAEVALTHDVASGQGRADIDAHGLVFAKEGLQPNDLSPMADIAREAEGPAAFTGELTWGPEGVTSAGRLSTTGLNFRSPAGQITGLRTDIDFVSLAPLVSAPDQQVTFEQLSAIVPLSDVKASFNLAESAVHIDGATATAADGRITLEPLDIPVTRRSRVCWTSNGSTSGRWWPTPRWPTAFRSTPWSTATCPSRWGRRACALPKAI